MPTRFASDALARTMRGPTASSIPLSSDTHPNWTISPSHPPSQPNPNPSASPSPNAKSKPLPGTPPPPPPAPSSSLLLLSPSNRILLLHRLSTSSSFASAHVFPGGHVDMLQDGALPPVSDPACHEDSLEYRRAGVRECFEESGILCARYTGDQDDDSAGGVGEGEGRDKEKEGNGEKRRRRRRRKGELMRLSEADREEGRRAVHSNKVRFLDWVRERGGEVDTGGLVPFTRWLTPANIPRRFSTQMYLYFLPLEEEGGGEEGREGGRGEEGREGGRGEGMRNEGEEERHVPTPDGGVEHTAAEFAYAEEWIARALKGGSASGSGGVVLFPPQFFLLSLIAEFLKPVPSPSPSETGSGGGDGKRAREGRRAVFAEQRRRLMEFVERDGDPPWGEKCISPDPVKLYPKRRRMIMGLERPGPELEGTGRRGDGERVIVVELDEEEERGRQRPRPKEVIWRRDWEGEGWRRKL